MGWGVEVGILWGHRNVCLEPEGLLLLLRSVHFIVCKLHFKKERSELCFIFLEYRKINNNNKK